MWKLPWWYGGGRGPRRLVFVSSQELHQLFGHGLRLRGRYWRRVRGVVGVVVRWGAFRARFATSSSPPCSLSRPLPPLAAPRSPDSSDSDSSPLPEPWSSDSSPEQP